MIQAGILRDVITIQKPVATLDSLGQEDTAYVDLYPDIRAKVYPLSGREYTNAQQVAADVTTRITMRRVPGIDATCRILRTIEADSPPTLEVYDVLAVLPDPVSGLRYLTLMCVQRITEGWRRGAEVDAETVGPFTVDNPELNVDDPSWGVDSD